MLRLDDVTLPFTKDFANYKAKALEISPTIVNASTAVFDVIGYFGCLRVERSTLKP